MKSQAKSKKVSKKTASSKAKAKGKAKKDLLSSAEKQSVASLIRDHSGLDVVTGKGTTLPYPVFTGRKIAWFKQVPVMAQPETEGGFGHYSVGVIPVKAPAAAKAKAILAAAYGLT